MTFSIEPIKKSHKKVVELQEIIRPFVLTPDVDIFGGVNGVPYFFPRGKASEVTLSQYEVLINSAYAEKLRS